MSEQDELESYNAELALQEHHYEMEREAAMGEKKERIPIGANPISEAERHERRKNEFLSAVTRAANYSNIDTMCDMRDYLIAEYVWRCVEALAIANKTEQAKRAS